MGRHRAGTLRGGQRGDAVVRREVIKGLLINGYAEPEIADQLVKGIPYDGRTLTATRRQVAADLAALGEEWRGLSSDPDVVEREVGAIKARVTRLAVDAAAAAFPAQGKRDPAMARVALNANAFLFRLAQIRSPGWRAPAAPARSFGAQGGQVPQLAQGGQVYDAAELTTAEETTVLDIAAEIRSLSDAELVARVRAQRARLTAALLPPGE